MSSETYALPKINQKLLFEPTLGNSLSNNIGGQSLHGFGTEQPGTKLFYPAAATSTSIQFMSESVRLSRSELDQQKIIYPEMERVELLDRYRGLRTKLLSLSHGKNSITIVTSVAPKSGTTHICLNLAAVFALDHTKTALLIDCNVRHPQLHKRFMLEPECGLTDFLADPSAALEAIIYSTGIDRLRLIPAGNRNECSGELFSSMRMKALLDVLKSRFNDRHIFIDAPPVLHSADARILTEICDQVVLNVPYGKVDCDAVNRSIDSLGKDKLAGVVVNEL